MHPDTTPHHPQKRYPHNIQLDLTQIYRTVSFPSLTIDTTDSE